MYLQLPEQLVSMPEVLLSSEGARDSSTCKVNLETRESPSPAVHPD